MKNVSSITLSSETTIRYLVVIAILLLAANILAIFMRHFTNHDHVFGLVAYFNFDSEMNPSTLFSTCLFLINSALFQVVYAVQCKDSNPQRIWIFLSCLFCFLALDEFSSLHERLIFPVQNALNTSGYLYFAWVIPYGIATFALAIFFVPVFNQLNRRNKIGFSLSAITYISGAIGFEMIGGKYLETISQTTKKIDLTYDLITTMEESLEIVGLILLVYTLISMVEISCGGFNIRIGRPRKVKG